MTSNDNETIYPVTICPERFRFVFDGREVAIPCCWNYPLGVQKETIEQVVIIVHGVLRNADEYFSNMMAVVSHAGKDETTLVIAPQFLLIEDIERFGLSTEVIYWGGDAGEGWKRGDDSVSIADHPRVVTVSSFEVVDRIVEKAVEANTFPNLRNIIITGHSAGGQYVNRYAAGSQIEQVLPSRIHLRFIVANPSTYMYFSPQRRVPGETSVFEVPQDADPNFDNYKYGLRNLNPYMAVAGDDHIRQEYPLKDVVYLLGGEDTREAHLEQTPNAMLQGVNRLERGQVYYHYLQHSFGESITHHQKIAIIPCVGHDNAAIFKSEAGIHFLFDI